MLEEGGSGLAGLSKLDLRYAIFFRTTLSKLS